MNEYQCPKCKGWDYFIGKRNVSGAFFKILRTKEVAICKSCDEIMTAYLVVNPKVASIASSKKIDRIFLYVIAGLLILLLISSLSA
jgi:hypothetical protein